MKHKAKPVKGSARTKRFDVGGTVGALAGLGTLAYLMSRKKKGEAGKEFGPQGKFPQEDGGGTSTDNKPFVKPPPGVIFESDRARDRALRQSKDPKSNLVPEGADKDTLYESDKALVRTGDNRRKPAPVVKKAKPATTTAPKQGSTSTTGVDAGIEAGKKAKPNEERPSKPYPEKEAAARKAALKEEAIKKGSTFKGRSKDPIQGTVDSASKSMARTPAQKMAERAREVQRRREEAEKSRYKKGGTVKKYAEGGVTKSKPAPKKPLPANLQREKDNQDQDRRNRKEREEFDKGAPTRLKDQGSFKSGGMTASKRGDGIAMRGKTKGKMY